MLIRSLLIFSIFYLALAWQPTENLAQDDSQAIELDLGNGETILLGGYTREQVANFSPETIEEFRLGHRKRRLVTSAHRDKLYIDIRGSVNFLSTPEIRYIGQKPLIDFLNQEAIRGELVFTRDQDQKLKIIMEDFKAAIRKFESQAQHKTIMERFEGSRESGRTAAGSRQMLAALAQLKREKIEQLELANRKAAESLEGFLLPHQLQRMRQLVVRRYIRETGLLGRMVSGKLGESLEVTEVQKKQMMKTADALVSKLSDDAKDLKEKSFDDLLSVLEPWQSKRLNDLMIRDVSKTNLPIGVLYAQLDAESLDSADEISRTHPWPIYMPLCLPNEFLLDHFGRIQLEDIKPMENPETCDWSTIYGIFFVVGRSNLKDEHYLVELRFSARQLEQIKQLRHQWDEFQKRSSKELSVGREAQEWKKLRDEYKVEQHRLAGDIVLRFEEILSKQQLKTMKQIMTSIRIDRVGLLASLIESDLGDRLELSESQQEKLIAKAEEVRNRLIKESSQIEAAFEAELLKVLSREQRRAFEEQVGDKVEGIVGNLDVLAIQSTSEFATIHNGSESSDLKIDFSNYKVEK